MVFSSTIFLFFFLPICLLLYYIVPYKFKNFLLLMVSLVFYSWGEPRNILIMLMSIVANYYFGILLEQKKYKKFLWLFLVFDIGVLFVFKYLNFVVSIVSKLLNVPIEIPGIALPIGISFFTFQIISYIIDVYREDVKAQHNIVYLALYISLFPQLIAGPIVRYIDIEKQIINRKITNEKICAGVDRFIIGFSKKILIADQLANFVEVAFSGRNVSILTNWVGILAYTLQIYYDFSGYSDMAIGIGKMFGFDFLENFDYPYISKSVKEFWRRWHISLGAWFRDYVYIPLGGSRKGKIKTYINLLIVFALTGLWHGASFNFIFWGLYYAFFLILERQFIGKILQRIPKLISGIYTFVTAMIGWVFFRADNLTSAIEYIRGMFSFAGNDVINYVFAINRQTIFCIIIGLVFMFPHVKIEKYIENHEMAKNLKDMLLIVLFFIAICYMVGSGYSPFLYFRF